jgi:hypothetical protein
VYQFTPAFTPRRRFLSQFTTGVAESQTVKIAAIQARQKEPFLLSSQLLWSRNLVVNAPVQQNGCLTLKKAVTGQALIVNKCLVEFEHQYGGITDSDYVFVLKMDHPSRSYFSDQNVIMVVREGVYKNYAKGDVVRVYYSGEDPLEFIIEGE